MSKSIPWEGIISRECTSEKDHSRLKKLKKTCIIKSSHSDTYNKPNNFCAVIFREFIYIISANQIRTKKRAKQHMEWFPSITISKCYTNIQSPFEVPLNALTNLLEYYYNIIKIKTCAKGVRVSSGSDKLVHEWQWSGRIEDIERGPW